jgi:hypothetical protein
VLSLSTPDGHGGYTWINARSDAVAVPGTWVQLVGEFDAVAGRVLLFVNGQPQAFGMSGGRGWYSTGSLFVGTTGTTNFFGGSIDQVQVWQGLLNAREVSNLYLAG